MGSRGSLALNAVVKTDAECNPREAGTISLAVRGPQRTVVKTIADPDSSGNVHEAAAAGAFGQFSIRCVNKPHATNPKTSHLAVLAAIAALRGYCEPGPRLGARGPRPGTLLPVQDIHKRRD